MCFTLTACEYGETVLIAITGVLQKNNEVIAMGRYAINGVVCERGRKCAVATPINDRIVWKLSKGADG